MSNTGLSLFDLSKREKRPEFDKRIIEGIPYHQFKGAIAYLEGKFHEIEPIANRVGLEFKGIYITRPQTETHESYISHRSSGWRLRLDNSKLYMVEVRYDYMGKPLRPFYTRLPYVERGNKVQMDGKTFFLSAVLIDRGANLSKDSIFLSSITRAKINFTRMRYTIKVNNIDTNAATLFASLHMASTMEKEKLRAKGEERLKINPLIFIYLLIQKGVVGTMKEYFGVDAIFEEGTFEALAKKYPLDEYVIYSSTCTRPRTLSKDRWVEPTIHMIVRDTSFENQEFLNILAVNFFYIYDHFSSMIDIDNLDDTDLWEIIAGHIIFNYSESNAKLAERVRIHIERSIDVLLDISAYKELAMDGIDVKDVYELLAWLIRNGTSIFMSKNPASMANKRLASLRYTLAPIYRNINRLGYALLNLGDNKPSPDNMCKIIKARIKEGLIRDIRKDHGEVSSLQCATDNVFLNVTRNIVPQSRALTKTSESGLPMYCRDNFFHSTILVYGQISGISKPEPTGRGYINPFVRVDAYGNLSHDPAYDALLSRLDRMIRYDYGFNEELTDD